MIQIIRCHNCGKWLDTFCQCPCCGRNVAEPELSGPAVPFDPERSPFDEPGVIFVNGYPLSEHNL